MKPVFALALLAIVAAAAASSECAMVKYNAAVGAKCGLAAPATTVSCDAATAYCDAGPNGNDTGTCRPLKKPGSSCAAAEECTNAWAGALCSGGVCGEGGKRLAAPCTADEECAFGACINAVCAMPAPAARGGVCFRDPSYKATIKNHCGAGDVCLTPPPTVDDNPQGKCVQAKANGTACSSAQECFSISGMGGSCHPTLKVCLDQLVQPEGAPCDTTIDCAAGLVCSSSTGRCARPQMHSWYPCDSHGQCKSPDDTCACTGSAFISECSPKDDGYFPGAFAVIPPFAACLQANNDWAQCEDLATAYLLAISRNLLPTTDPSGNFIRDRPNATTVSSGSKNAKQPNNAASPLAASLVALAAAALSAAL